MAHEQCPACKAALDEPVLLCPHCGASTLPEMTAGEAERLREPTAAARAGLAVGGWILWGVFFVIGILGPVAFVGHYFMDLDTEELLVLLGIVGLLVGAGVGMGVLIARLRAKQRGRTHRWKDVQFDEVPDSPPPSPEAARKARRERRREWGDTAGEIRYFD